MNYIRLKELDVRKNIGERVYVVFLCLNVEVKNQKNNDKYIQFDMIDGDMKLEGKIFSASEAMISRISSGKVYKASVDLKPWAKAPMGVSGIIYNIEDEAISGDIFMNWAENMEESAKILSECIGSIKNEMYKSIVYKIVSENWGRFSKWSAALNQHHNSLGGLLVHTAEVVELCKINALKFNELYGDGFIDISLLVSAAILHDIGKVRELDVDIASGEVKYSKESALISHIMEILKMVDVTADNLGYGKQTYGEDELGNKVGLKNEAMVEKEVEELNLLRHCLASHHGKLEYGSPVIPVIPEAYILHVIDDLDAEMFRYRKIFKEMLGGETNSYWNSQGIKKTYKASSKI